MRKAKVRCFYILCLLLVVGIFLALWLLLGSFLYTANTLSLTYSRSASSFPSSEDRFYIRNNVLYFIEERGDKAIVRSVKNNIIRTFAEIPQNYERFIILNEETVIVQIKSTVYSLNVKDGNLMELWQGSSVEYCENQIYFTYETALYTAKDTESEPRNVVSFDELLGSYNDGIVYRSGDCIYQLLYEQPNTPQLLTDGEIPWQNDKVTFVLDVSYLYTSDYAVRIGSHALDIYVYKTGEIQRIYETDVDNMVIMAVVAGKNELYVSRQWSDLKFYPLKNKEINGTYKYDVQAKSWTKISDKVCSMLAQFDKQSLYGFDLYGVDDKIKRIETD